jgi:LysM repeat protein
MQRPLLTLALAMGVTALVSGSASADSAPPAKQAAATVAAPIIHEVASGDSLSTIAAAESLSSWRPLWNANSSITDPNLIYPGQKIVVPSGDTTDRALPAGVSDQLPAQQVQAVAPQGRVSVAPRAASYASGSGGIFARIRQRESGGNYATNTGNGYYGAYQYNIGTWGNYGGYARADLAPAAVQDAKAALTYAQRGCSPWPNTCY